MTLQIFQPMYLAEKCFLSEALLWVAFCRVPEDFWENGVDCRFDPQFNDEYIAQIIGGWGQQYTQITDEECAFANLARNPWYATDEDQGEHYCGRLAMLEEAFKILKGTGLPAEDQEKFERDIKEARIYDEKCAQWRIEFEKYIEVPKSKLFLALREGKLTALGRTIPPQKLNNLYCQIGSPIPSKYELNWHDFEHEKIPKELWMIDGIRWDESAAVDGVSHYMHIYVEVEELFKEFPLNDGAASQPITNSEEFRLVSGNLFWPEGDARKAHRPKRTGRPPMVPWDEFYLEVTKRLLVDKLPDQQEAFIEDMRDWCFENFKARPKRTCILNRVSPYYREFIRKKSESE